MIAILVALLYLALLVIAIVFVSDTYPRLVRLLWWNLAVTVLIILIAFMLVRNSIVRVEACTPDCIGANLLRRDLRGFDLRHVKLIGANLREADLTGAALTGADLSGALLAGATLENANLISATILGADLTAANLVGVALRGADLSGSVLNEANLTGVDLTEVVLAGVWLQRATLVDANLAGVTLVTTDLTGARLNGAQLTNANLSGSTLSEADLSGARLTGVNLSGAWLNRTLLIGADLTKADLSVTSLVAANLASADLTESNLIGANLVGLDLKGANLQATRLQGAKLYAADLTDEDLLDPVLAELNELQRSRLLVDVSLAGISFDDQTIWPDTAVAEQVQPAETTITTRLTPSETIKVGILHSLTGPLAISELALRDAELLAIKEINAAGGVLGKQLLPVTEDGGGDPSLFADKARKLLDKDRVTVIFGGGDSASRQAMLPVLEELESPLFFPMRHEGMEDSPYVFYIGADPSQQVIPAVGYLLQQGWHEIFLLGTDSVYPRAINAIVKAQLDQAGYPFAGEYYLPESGADFTELISQWSAAPPAAVFSTLSGESNVAFYQQLAAAGFVSTTLPVLSVSVAEAEIRAIGAQSTTGHLTAWTYYQTGESAENAAFVSAYKAAYGLDRVTADPIARAYAAVYLWKALVEQAQSTALADLQSAAATGEIEFLAPGGPVTLVGQHTTATARVGMIRADGLIEEIWSSNRVLAPDPFLTRYPWAAAVVEEWTNREVPE